MWFMKKIYSINSIHSITIICRLDSVHKGKNRFPSLKRLLNVHSLIHLSIPPCVLVIQLLVFIQSTEG